jgi:ribosomal protein L16 Arg81 hydroxylase
MSPLDFLLHPYRPSDFFEKTWNQRALLLKGDAARFQFLYAPQDWKTGLGATRIRAAQVDDSGAQVEAEIESKAIEAAYWAGHTICADVSQHHRVLPFLEQLGAQFRLAGGPCFAKLYTSNNDRGFALHLDAFHVFVLQLEGQKRWTFSPTPAVPSAHCGGFINAQGIPLWAHPQQGERMLSHPGRRVAPPIERELCTEVLSPGDMLYLPPGTWHKTQALEHSVALSISPPRLTIAQLMLRTLEEQLLQDPDWRVDAVGCGDVTPRAGHTFASVEALFASRLEALQSHLRAFDTRILHRAWQLNVRTRLQSVPAAEQTQIDRHTHLSHRTVEPLHFLLAPTASGTEEALLYHQDTEWALPKEAAPFLTELLKHHSFEAQDAETWDRTLTWPETKDLLEQLVAAGLLRVV